jgi:hypothetical protein
MNRRLSLFVMAMLFADAAARAQYTQPAVATFTAGQDPILYWNEVMLDANAIDHSLFLKDQPGPCYTTRAFAIVSTAMFDAFNSVGRRYQPYHAEIHGLSTASIPVAVSRAAHDTLKALYPQQAWRFAAAHSRVLATIPAGTAKNHGQELGRRVAAAILALRAADGSQTTVPYDFTNEPGFHQVDPLHPNQGIYAPHWGGVKPWVIGDVDDYLPPPPPALDSFEYAAAYNQLIAFGGDGVETPTNRSRRETITGIFWGYDGTPGLGTPPRMYNQIARTIAIQKQNSMEQNARLFALINLAMADAAIQCWHAKYVYELWRPVIAIQNGENDGNPFTIGEPLWTPLGAPATNGAGDGVNFTPPFPAYTSGHATMGAAGLHSISKFYGTGAIAFRFTSDEFNGINRNGDGTRRSVVTRSYRTLDAAILENALSRVYLGIHYSFDAFDGMNSGYDIAEEVAAKSLHPRRK